MEARLYDRLGNKTVKCRLCSHFCIIKPGGRGICQVRENQAGILVTRVYDRIIACAVDPVEKKPIFHLRPGSLSYSIATVGCNLRCRFCQNSPIAHDLADPGQLKSGRMGSDSRAMGEKIQPQEIVNQALASGCDSISFTYTEPTVFFELACDTARLAKEKGLYNIFVTNGYMSAEALETVAPFLDAANVDLKAFDDKFYKTYCNARLEPVKDRLRQMQALGILVEVTTLLIPGLNDGEDGLKAMAGFIADELGCDTPWHISRFHPCYKMTDRGPTPLSSLERACGIGRQAGLKYVYLGNVPGSDFENTRCHECNTLVVERNGYQTKNYMTGNGACPNCGTRVYGIMV